MIPKVPDNAYVWVRCDYLISYLWRPCIAHKWAHPALVVLEEAEERALCKLVSQDIELCQAGQGGSREQVILVSLYMLEMNGNACDGVMDPTDSLDKICMGAATWCELLVCCAWWRAPRLSHPTVTDPEVMA